MGEIQLKTIDGEEIDGKIISIEMSLAGKILVVSCSGTEKHFMQTPAGLKLLK